MSMGGHLTMCFLAVLASSFAISGCSDSPEDLLVLPEYRYYDIQWCFPGDGATSAIDLSAERARATVYELQHERRTYQYVQQLARELDIDTLPVYEPRYESPLLGSMDAAFHVEGDSGELIVDEHQPVIWYRSKASAQDDREGSRSLSESEAKKMARDFLRSIGLHPTGEVEVSVDRSSSTRRIVVLSEAAHVRVDFPTAPFKIEVQFDQNGAIWGLSHYWQESSELGGYPLISEKEALERLKRCQGIIYPHDERMSITHVETTYIGVPVEGPYEYLIPAFHFWDDFPSVPQHAFIPAIVEEYLPMQSAATPVRD